MTRKKTSQLGTRISPRKAVAFLLLGLAAVTGFGLLSPTRDSVTEGLILLVRRLFGAGVYAAPIALGLIGFGLLAASMGKRPWLSWRRPLGALLLFLAALPALHLLSFPPDARLLASQGGGGGHVGWILSQALTAALGTMGAYIFLALAGAVGVLLLSGLSLARLAGVFQRAYFGLKDRLAEHPLRLKMPGWLRRRPKTPALPATVRTEGREAHKPSPAERRLPSRTAPHPGPSAPGGREWRLPELEAILELNAVQEVSETEIRRKVRIIEDTLRSFGVPGRVVEVSQGPTVTQFGVQPGYVERKQRDGRLVKAKVRVSRIGALSSDLSLALAAAPIRIEAPVPGRAMIGIEVPNDQVSVVPLRRVMESDRFRRATSRLKVALGQDVSGQPVMADLGKMPHLLIAGATGSGKSVCINSLVTCLLLGNSPHQLRLLMVDPKMVELVSFNGIPHLLSPVVVEVRQVVAMLRWALREMDRRYKLFSAAHARNLDHYNAHFLPEGGTPLPYLVVVIDELADLMLAAPDEVESSLCRLAQMARATGIHLIVATQRPSVDVVTGLIKANFPARISFAVTSQTDSRVILDMVGAETLLGRGDMLYIAADSSAPLRLQGCFVSDKEIARLVRFWKGLELPAESRAGEPVQQALWPEMEETDQVEPKEDELLGEAMELVRRERQASASFLQRRLRIGYVRASRLMDQLEERGVVGPPEGAASSRRILERTEEIPWTTN